MRPIFYSYTPADNDLNGFASTVGGTAGVAFVQQVYTVGDNLAHLVTIDPSGSVSGNYTLTGTDSDGFSQTETLATDTVNTVTSVKYFLTLTSVLAPSGIGAETVEIGWSDVCIGPTVPLNRLQVDFQVSLGVDISGTINYTVQHCLRDIRAANPSTLTWWPHASLVSKTADTDGNYASPVSATRLLINSSTSGATINFQILQGAS